MQQMGELLMKLQGKSASGCDIPAMTQKDFEQWKADQYNATEGDLNDTDGYNCELCKNRGDSAVVVHNDQFGYWTETLVPCKCQRIRQAIRRLNRSGLKNIVKDYTFAKYECPEAWQQKIKQTAMAFCKDDASDWFFIGGQSGAGKTHICTAIAVHYIKAGMDCRYMLWRDEIARIKAMVNDHEAYDQLMRPLKETPVLYIDDLFKGGKGDDGKYKPPTAADVNAAFEIINYRYNNPGLITIISSERTLADMFDIDEAIAGRITERTKARGYCFNLRKDRSRNWRLKGLDEI